MAPTPFGKEARDRILRQHFDQVTAVTAQTAWKFVYTELLWIDGSTGLAHLYESDKAQPGRPWYDRSTTFTNLLCREFGGISRTELGLTIDRLFRACLEELLDVPETLAGLSSVESDEVEPLRFEHTMSEGSGSSPYVPDVALVTEFARFLAERLTLSVLEVERLARDLVARARTYYTVERKRQNVLGEGFEDLLQLLILRISGVPEASFRMRQRATKLPGFLNRTTTRDRVEAPDFAIVRDGKTELLASVKWSLRHDRQKQLSDELDCYVDLLSQDRFPRYILVTNEYDPGRLVNTDGLRRRGQAIDCVYHMNLDLLLGVLHDHARAKDLHPLMASGRLKSLEHLLVDLAQEYAPK